MKKGNALASLFSAFILLAVLASSAWGAWVIEQTESVPSQGQSIKKLMIFGTDALRMDMPEAKTSIIMHFGKDRMFFIDHGQQMYSAMPISVMAAQAREMLPKAKPTDSIATQKTTEFKEINGFPSQKIIVNQGGKAIGEIWITKAIDTTQITKVYEKFFEMVGFGGADASGSIALIDGLKAALQSGFPVYTKMTMPDGTTVVVETTSATEKNMDASQFLPPTGYKQLQLPPGMTGDVEESGPAAPIVPPSTPIPGQ